MMNVSLADARGMSLWDYEALLYHWNEAHSTDVAAPDHDKTQRLIDKINTDPKLYGKGTGRKEPMRLSPQA